MPVSIIMYNIVKTILIFYPDKFREQNALLVYNEVNFKVSSNIISSRCAKD